MAEPRCTRFYISDILDAENTFVTGDEQRDLHRNREIICTRSNPRSRWLDDIHGLEREGERRVKRPRTSFSAEQINLLESEFHSNKYIAVSRRLELSQALGLSESQTNEMDVTIRHLHQHNQIYTIGGLPAWLLSPLQGVSTLQGSLSASEAISSAAPLNNADNRDNAPSDQFAKQPRSLLPN